MPTLEEKLWNGEISPIEYEQKRQEKRDARHAAKQNHRSKLDEYINVRADLELQIAKNYGIYPNDPSYDRIFAEEMGKNRRRFQI